MKLRFETCFRGLLIVLLICAACSLWAGAETNTNVAAATLQKTNQPSVLAREVQQHFEQRYLTFGLDRVPVLREIHFLGEPLWKYLASVIYIFLVFYVAKLFDLIAVVWLRRLAAKTQTKLYDLLLELLHGPVKIIAFAILLQIGLNIFDWSDSTRLYLSKGLILVVAAALTYLTIKVVDVLLEFWSVRAAHENKRFDDQLFSIIRKSLKGFVVVVALLVTASNVGINITAAITSLSIGGLAVGLAAQDTLANLFGAVAIFADKPFEVGDQIRLDVAEGTVVAVGLRSTRLRNPDGHVVSIPNKTMGNAAITNVSQRPNIKTTMNLALARNLPTEKVRRALQILDEVYRKHPMTQDVWISFNQFTLGATGTNLNIMIVHWWKGTDYQKYLAGMQEMNVTVKQLFDAEGIGFA